MAITVTRCCFCFSLRCASIAIAVSCILMMTILMYDYVQVINGYHVKGNYSKTGISLPGAIVGLISSGIHVLCSVVLLIGICMYRRKLFIPWIIWTIVECVKQIIFVLIMIYALIMGSENPHIRYDIAIASCYVVVSLNYIVDPPIVSHILDLLHRNRSVVL